MRDKLAAVTQKSDRLTEKYYRAKKGMASNEMKLLLEKNDKEIKLLEQQLQDIQKTEMERRQRQAAVSSNPPSTDKEEVRVHLAIASTKPSSANTEEGTICSMIVIEDFYMVSFNAHKQLNPICVSNAMPLRALTSAKSARKESVICASLLRGT